MKWVVFAIAAFVGVPVMAAMATWRPARKWLLAALTCSTVAKISVNFCSLESYRGADRGYEAHLTDLIMISLAVGLICSSYTKLKLIPFNAPLACALFCSLALSTITATSPLLASFTMLKVMKGFCLYWTVYNVVRIDRSLDGIWWGAIGAAGVLTASVIWQKYGHGVHRVHGTFDHSNTIPAYSLLLMPFLLNWVLHTRTKSMWALALGTAAVIGLCLSTVASLSRVGALLAAGCLLATVAYAMARRPPDVRRSVVATLLVVCLMVGGWKAADTLLERFLGAPKASATARDEFNVAARKMAADQVFGVGLNCFSHALTNERAYAEHIEVMRNEQQAGVCHHIYWLTIAETGWIGFTIFALVLARFWTRPLLTAISAADEDRTLLLGFSTGVFCLHLIGMFEWVLRITPVFHMFLIVTGSCIAYCELLDSHRSPNSLWPRIWGHDRKPAWVPGAAWRPT